MTRPVRWRLAPLAGGAAALVGGVYAGLLLLGLDLPAPGPDAPGIHGPLMVFGFVGTLVALERAVALAVPWALLAPAASALGAVALIGGASAQSAGAFRSAQILLSTAGAGLLVVYMELWRRRQPTVALLVQAAGAAAWYASTLLWLAGYTVSELLPWLAAFVILTIVGERIELAGLMPRRRTADLLVAACTAALLAGATAALLWPNIGYHAWGIAVLATVVAAASTDVARHFVRARGLPRYAAAGILAGYAWLAAAGLLWTTGGPIWAGPRYDAVAHAVFLGFTISMIFVHAPVILPAVLRRPLPYHAVLYAPLALLHLSLVVRLGLGDLLGNPDAWVAGGIANVAAVLAFVACAVTLAVRANAGRRTPAATPAEATTAEPTPANAGTAEPTPTDAKTAEAGTGKP